MRRTLVALGGVALVVAALALPASSPAQTTGEITRAVADPGWTYGIVAGSVTSDYCSRPSGATAITTGLFAWRSIIRPLPARTRIRRLLWVNPPCRVWFSSPTPSSTAGPCRWTPSACGCSSSARRAGVPGTRALWSSSAATLAFQSRSPSSPRARCSSANPWSVPRTAPRAPRPPTALHPICPPDRPPPDCEPDCPPPGCPPDCLPPCPPGGCEEPGCGSNCLPDSATSACSPPACPSGGSDPCLSGCPDPGTDFSSFALASKQRVGNLLVKLSMAERGVVTVSGTVNVPNASRVYKLKPVSVTAAPGVPLKIRVKVPTKAHRAIKRALRRGKRVTAKLTITAKDARWATLRTAKRTVKLSALARPGAPSRTLA